MRTVQMTIEEELLKSVDYLIKKLGKSRSEFTREILREAVRKYEIQREEERHREGYRKKPVTDFEFNEWEDEQEWGD
jgi:metal-responsive CopG/Arc/MetJ family transcriptional regulator